MNFDIDLCFSLKVEYMSSKTFNLLVLSVIMNTI
jgi:hypothetical protein